MRKTMEGELTMDIRIVCVEHRKVSKTTLCIETWSELLDTVTLVIEEHDLVEDRIETKKVEVPLNQLVRAISAARKVSLA